MRGRRKGLCYKLPCILSNKIVREVGYSFLKTPEADKIKTNGLELLFVKLYFSGFSDFTARSVYSFICKINVISMVKLKKYVSSYTDINIDSLSLPVNGTLLSASQTQRSLASSCVHFSSTTFRIIYQTNQAISPTTTWTMVMISQRMPNTKWATN